jgi:DNA gyrase subunit A
VDGLLLALDKVDEVIDIVRAAPDPKTAKEKVQTLLGASEEQTESILRLQLGQLTRLNKGKLDAERLDLLKSQAELKNLIEVDNAVYDVMKEEFKELSTKFGVDRRSIILNENDGELSEMDLIRNSRSVIVVLRSGYIKRMPLGTFESQRRGTKGKRGAFDGGTGEQGDEVAHCFTCNDHDTLLMVTQNGIAHGIRAYQIPIGSRTAKGQPIPSVLPIGASDTITAVLRISEFVEDVYLLLATEHGFIKRTPVSAFENMTGRGLTIATLGEGDSLKWCHLCTDNDSILLGTKKGMATRFAAGMHPELWCYGQHIV